MEKLTTLNTDTPVTPRDYFREVSDLLVETGINGQLTKEEYISFCKGNYITQGDKYKFLNKTKDTAKQTPPAIYTKVLNMLALNKTNTVFSFGHYITFVNTPQGTCTTPKTLVKQVSKQRIASVLLFASQALSKWASKLG